MRGLIILAAGAMSCAVWLALLIATDFNPIAVSTGLLGALFVTGPRAAGSHPHSSLTSRKDTP